MVLQVMLFAVGVTMHLTVFFSLMPAAATGFRSSMPITVTIGRPFRTRTSTLTARGTSASIRAPAARTSATATAGGLFGLSKSSPNSERM